MSNRQKVKILSSLIHISKLFFLTICSRIVKRMEQLKRYSGTCYASYCGGRKFEVKQTDLTEFAVNTKMRVCSCRKWQLSGIPCIHAFAALGFEGEDPELYVAKCY